MMVVVAYDIAGTGADSARRLRKVSGICSGYGVKVQHSVYECIVDAEQYRALRTALERTIRKGEDSIRLYRLGNRYGGRIETLGAETAGWDRESFVL